MSDERNALSISRPGEMVSGEPGGLLDVVRLAVTSPDVDVQKLEALLRMQTTVEDRQAERLFNAALHAAQQAMPRVRKNGTIDLGKDKEGKPRAVAFATWEDVDTALRPIMREHGFSLSFDMAPKPGDGGGAIITGTLLHEAGHSKTASIPLSLDSGPGRNNLQAMGSTLSYGKRYLAEMFFNIVRTGQDDDGVAGGTRYVTEFQAEEIRKLLTETGAPEQGFLDYLEVRSVTEIRADQYTAAVNALHARARKANAGKATP